MVKILKQSEIVHFESRPWGNFEVLHEASRHKIKRLRINPYEKTSLQKHISRSEHWMVESGSAKVIIGDEVIYLIAGGSVDIAAGTLHRIENESAELLSVIEVQTGDFLCENDIVRVEDKYGRV